VANPPLDCFEAELLHCRVSGNPIFMRILTLFPGLIIAATVLVTGAIIIYESPEVRIWLDERRRRIAVAMYSVGDSINPNASSRASEAEADGVAEASRRRRQDIIRRNRNELIRRAQEEGIAVDLDELAAVGSVDAPPLTRKPTYKSFDELLNDEGKLRSHTSEMTEASTTAMEVTGQEGLRNRSVGARGWDRGASFANPFDDEAQVLFDRDLLAPASEELPTYSAPTTSSIRSLSPRPASTATPTLIDIPVFEGPAASSLSASQYKTDDELEAEIEEAIRRSLQDMPAMEVDRPWSDIPQPAMTFASSGDRSLFTFAQPPDSLEPPAHGLEDSLYAPPTPRRNSATLSPAPLSRTVSPQPLSATASFYDAMDVEDERGLATPSGARTPSEAAFSSISGTMSDDDVLTAASQAATDAEDVGVLADVASVQDIDGRSDADMSEFSVVGASTPGSWTDVDSESEAEEAGNGQRHR
jgi:hypothetical protein